MRRWLELDERRLKGMSWFGECQAFSHRWRHQQHRQERHPLPTCSNPTVGNWRRGRVPSLESELATARRGNLRTACTARGGN